MSEQSASPAMAPKLFKFSTYTKFVAFLERLVEVKIKPLNTALKDLEKKTAVKKVYFFHLFVLCISIYAAFNHFGGLSRYLITYLYPAFYTLDALRSKNENKCIQWLTFWSVFGALKIAESFTDAFLGFLPFYGLVKVLVIVWCYLPITNNGSVVVYKQILLPAMDLLQNNSLDALSNKAIDTLSDTLKLKMKNKPLSKKTKGDGQPLSGSLPKTVLNKAIGQLEPSLKKSQKQKKKVEASDESIASEQSVEPVPSDESNKTDLARETSQTDQTPKTPDPGVSDSPTAENVKSNPPSVVTPSPTPTPTP